MKRLFKVGSDRHDRGKVVFSWHPDGVYLASAGKNGTKNNHIIITTISYFSLQPF